MREDIYNGIKNHIQSISGFENIQIITIEAGHCELEVEITETMLNLYGSVHGGVLYTLCDIASGMSAYAYECSNVTLNGTINYLKPAGVGRLRVVCNTIHKGRTTVVNDVLIKDSEEDYIASARMTMYITKEL